MTDYNGTAGNDVFAGTSADDVAIGGAGDDTVSGAVGADVLAGGSGSDTLDGGDGDDKIYSGDRSPLFSFPWAGMSYTPPLLDTGTEVDTLRGGDGSDRLFAGYGDNVDGGANGIYGDYLFISFMGAASGVTADFRQETQVIGGGTITGVENISWIEGSNFADDINAGSYSFSGYTDFGAVFGMGGDDHLISGYYNNHLYGGDGSDVLDARPSGYMQEVFGEAGDDTIYTNNAGIAVVYGGDGDDTIYSGFTTYGGAGDDVIVIQQSGRSSSVFGEAGDDQITVTDTGWTVSGGSGADILNGGAGADTLFAGDVGSPNQTPAPDMGLEHDVLNGAGGADNLWAGYGDDVDGGAGTDVLFLSLGGLASGITFSTADLVAAVASQQAYVLGGGTITGVETFAYLRGSEFADTLTIANQSTRLTVDAGAGDDVIVSQNAPVDALGGAGDDRFIAGVQADSFNGGAGVDTVDYSAFAVGVTVNLANGLGAANHALAMVENVDGTAQNDVLTGDAGANVLRGMAGDDTLNGGAGGDTLIGGTGNDTYSVDNTADVIVENAAEGVDAVFSSVTYTLSANVEKLTLTGSAAINGTGNADDNVITGNAGANLLIGGDGNDTLIGGDGDTLIGGAGGDLFDGTAGNVTVSYLDSSSRVTITIGGPDSTSAASGGDASGDVLVSIENVIGSAFDDMIVGTSVDNVLTGDAGGDSLFGFAGNDTLRGGAGDDWLLGGLGNDLLDGDAGADRLTGGDGNDTYLVDDAQDLIEENGAEGTDLALVSTTTGLTAYTLTSMASIETLATVDPNATTALDLTGNEWGQTIQGNAGANRIAGGGGNDTLSGFAGDDILTGGDRNDTLTGGAGADLFRDTASGLNGDTITDLSVGDKIQITDANIATFSFSLKGSALTYSGGTLTLATLPAGYHLEASAAAQGVNLSLVRTLLPNNGLSGDFNGDGKDDLMWRSDAGQMSNWLGQANGGFVGNDANAFTTVSTAWHIVGAGDFNGDGRDDLVWRSDAGELSDWLGKANGGFIGNDGNAFTTVSTAWQVAGVGDFNGDGRDDLVWRSDSGQMSDWLGQANGGFVGNDANAFRTVGTDWHIVGVGDFNGDHRDDILWRSDAGQLSNWLGQANGSFAGNDANAFATVGTDWHIVGVGDFNGDGRDDILWRSDSGQMSNWLGTASGGWAGNDLNAFTNVSTEWLIVGVGDFNGDGRDDIVWRNGETGAMSDWLARADGSFAGNDANAFQVVDTSWHIQVSDLFAI